MQRLLIHGEDNSLYKQMEDIHVGCVGRSLIHENKKEIKRWKTVTENLAVA